MRQLITDFKEVYDLVRREILYNILNEFSILMKLVGLIKLCLSETYGRVWVGKHMSDMFPIRNGLKQQMLYLHCFSVVLSSMPLGWFR